MTPLRTRSANALLLNASAIVATWVSDVDADPGAERSETIRGWHESLDAVQARAQDQSDAFFDDLYVLQRCVDFLDAYARLWGCIVRGECAASWRALQDCLDDLRTIRTFSSIDIRAFETPLVELERAYPYKVFFSIGATVGWFECSICGLDIDSLACQHRRRHLYRGKMAIAIAREAVALDHVAMVDVPRDKRCVVSYEDDAPGFAIILMLRDLITSCRLKPSQFARLRFSKRRAPNPEVRMQGRNDRCACGSGQKFKRCCATRLFVETDHVDIVAAFGISPKLSAPSATVVRMQGHQRESC